MSVRTGHGRAHGVTSPASGCAGLSGCWPTGVSGSPAGGLADPDRLRAPGVEGHLIDLLNIGAQSHGSGVGVLDVDDLSQKSRRVLVAALVRQSGRLAEQERGRVIVAGVACREALLDGVGQFDLSGVVGDGRVDAGREVRVLAPDRTHQGLGLNLVTEHHLDPGGEAFGPDRRDRDPDRDVVVAGLVTPRTGRILTDQVGHRDRPVRQVLHDGGDLAHEEDLGSLRRPDTQPRVGHTPTHGALDHRLEVGLHGLGARDDVDRPEQRRRDPSELVDLPVVADPSAVTLEHALGGLDGAIELGGGLALLLAVGQEDGVTLRSGCGEEELPEGVDPGTDRRRPRCADLTHDPLRLLPNGLVHHGEHRIERIDHL